MFLYISWLACLFLNPDTDLIDWWIDGSIDWSLANRMIPRAQRHSITKKIKWNWKLKNWNFNKKKNIEQSLYPPIVCVCVCVTTNSQSRAKNKKAAPKKTKITVCVRVCVYVLCQFDIIVSLVKSGFFLLFFTAPHRQCNTVHKTTQQTESIVHRLFEKTPRRQSTVSLSLSVCGFNQRVYCISTGN